MTGNMIYDISHRTTYGYSQPVSISHHLLHLSPRPCPHQRIHRTAMRIQPIPSVTSNSVDYFGNPITHATLQQQHNELAVTTRSVIEVFPRERPETAASPAWKSVAETVENELSPDGLAILEFAFTSPYTVSSSDLLAFSAPSFAPGRPLLEAVCDLTAQIFKQFRYDSTATNVSTPVDEVLQLRRGVCQDFAHLEIACLRARGIPARYVSGYLVTHPPAGSPRLEGADASHAWVSVWCPRFGWVDFDPTNNVLPANEHITLAWGRDYGDVSPLNGVIFGGGEHSVEVAVNVRPIAGLAD